MPSPEPVDHADSADPAPDAWYRNGIPILFGVLAIVPVLVLVIGLATQQRHVAAAAIPMGVFFGCAGRASWVRAQARAAILAGDVPAFGRLRRQAALWGLLSLVAIGLAVLVLNL